MDLLSGTGIIYMSFMIYLFLVAYKAGYEKACKDMRKKSRKKHNI